jgi:PleD family two-component response regulator
MPILVLTSRNRVEDRVECLDLGADDFLSMPFSFSEPSAEDSGTPAAKPSVGSFGAQRH